MNASFNFNSDVFIPAVVLSIGLHGAVIGAAGWVKPVEYAVLKAPSSIEITLIEEVDAIAIDEPVIEDAVEETIEEPIEDVFEASTKPISEPQMIEAVPIMKTKSIPQEKSQPVQSFASQGAMVDAKPITEINHGPEYPRRARKRGWEGTVELKVYVEKNGWPSNVRVTKSSGYSLLDRAAVYAVKKWRFAPAEVGGVKLSSSVIIPVDFRLKNYTGF